MSTILNNTNKAYIRRNCQKKSSKEMAEHIGCCKGVVSRFLKKNNLTPSKKIQYEFRSKALTGRTTFTPKEDAFIKKNYLKYNIKTLAKKMGRSYTGVMGRINAMHLIIPDEIRQRNLQACRFKKGQVSFNKGKKQSEYMSRAAIRATSKTRFKKGHQPHNSKKTWTEVLRKDKTGRAYWMIKVEGRRKLVHKHIFLWENKNGKAPKGFNVVFKDGNPLNCIIENLECISNEELMYRNSIHHYSKEIIPTLIIINKLKKKIYEKQND